MKSETTSEYEKDVDKKFKSEETNFLIFFHMIFTTKYVKKNTENKKLC